MQNDENRNYARRYTKEYHLLRFLFQIFAISIGYPFFKIVYNLKIEGRENLPKGSHYIYAGNHVSMFDPLLVSTAVFRPIAYMAKVELFGQDALGWWVKRLGAFAVNRKKPEISTFKTVKDIFKTNWALGIFPQGGIKDNKTIEKLQKGFAIIAQNAKADIVPIAICGFGGYTKKPFSQNLKLIIGKPISYQQPPEDILIQWSNFICENTGFKNMITKEYLEHEDREEKRLAEAK